MPTFRWFDIYKTEAIVRNRTDKSKLRTAELITELQRPPVCHKYSTDGTGYQCLPRVSLTIDKFGFHGLHELIDELYLTPT